jgi:hypothetical protein
VYPHPVVRDATGACATRRGSSMGGAALASGGGGRRRGTLRSPLAGARGAGTLQVIMARPSLRGHGACPAGASRLRVGRSSARKRRRLNEIAAPASILAASVSARATDAIETSAKTTRAARDACDLVTAGSARSVPRGDCRRRSGRRCTVFPPPDTSSTRPSRSPGARSSRAAPRSPCRTPAARGRR